MLSIKKISLASPIDYAADELKKYLRMMMPECGDVTVEYAPGATDGFRLGLMQDFGLDTSDVSDVGLDDIIYIKTDTRGGTIAGSNPRSVLLAVYEYLRQNGCRWLMPGVDGEYIPMRDIRPVEYRHVPSCRYRGWCNEGSESQECMFDTIDFAPKVGLNTYMLEFKIPTSYYKRYYNHMKNEEARAPEPVSDMQILQWKIQCEAEIERRGLSFHDMGHGWSADPFGIDSSLRAWDGDNEARVPDGSRKFLAEVKGERKLWHNVPNYTQYCMSSVEARTLVTNAVADYAERHTNVDFLHIWLGDGVNNHCECENCRKKTASDWYIIQLNEIDRELSRRKIATRVVFIAYLDTIWAPVEEKLEHPERFSLLFAPISRRYTESVPAERGEYELSPFKLNENKLPASFAENFAYFDEWKKDWHGDNLAYEYHFWRHQYFDFGGLFLSSIINDDVRGYKRGDINGIIEDGSQRSFFPTGLPFYTYARSLYDLTLSADEIAEDYFTHAFGAAGAEFRKYLTELGDVFDMRYLEGESSADPEISPYYNPEYAKGLTRVKKITERGRQLIKKYYNSEYRLHTVSVRLLEHHADFADMLADALIAKACGNDGEATRLYNELRLNFGKREAAIEPYYDHGLAFISLDKIFNTHTRTVGIVTELGN